MATPFRGNEEFLGWSRPSEVMLDLLIREKPHWYYRNHYQCQSVLLFKFFLYIYIFRIFNICSPM